MRYLIWLKSLSKTPIVCEIVRNSNQTLMGEGEAQ